MADWVSTLPPRYQTLLDFSRPEFDVPALEEVIAAMYGGDASQRAMSQQLLTALKESPDGWLRVSLILDAEPTAECKFYALQILDEAVKLRWAVLPPEQKEGIKVRALCCPPRRRRARRC